MSMLSSRKPISSNNSDAVNENEPSIRSIIESGRREPKPRTNSTPGIWAMPLISAGLLWASFTPLDYGPLAWIALVPLMLLVRLRQPPRHLYKAVFLGGWLTMMVCLQWMRLGHIAMYPAWFALATYCALYFPLFVAASRLAVHQLRMPMVVAIPVVWVGLEFLRAHLMTGFAWYYLGHTQYYWTELIQISDVVGAYGVSFIVAMVAAAIAGILPDAVFLKCRLLPDQQSDQPATSPNGVSGDWQSVVVTSLVFAVVLTYGFIRRSQADFDSGPRVALVQGNFTSEVKHDPTLAAKIQRKHYWLTALATQHQPDIIIWPESMYRGAIMQVDPNLSDTQLKKVDPFVDPQHYRNSRVAEELNHLATKSNAHLMIGITAREAKPDGVANYNSVAFVKPEVGLIARYDKLHRVPFGEFVPFAEQIPALKRLTPISSTLGISKGEAISVFTVDEWRMAPIICFEDTVPHLVRKIVRSSSQAASDEMPGPLVDVLVNLTNDGWFHGSSELDQHLITSAFRAVECRTPLVRAVNTGISAFIDGDGVIVEPELFIDADTKRPENVSPEEPFGHTSMRDPKTGKWHRQLNAVLVKNVPLDSRRSLYVKYGDWFAFLCAMLTGVTIMVGIFISRREKRAAKAVTV